MTEEISLHDLFQKLSGFYKYIRSKWLFVLVAGCIGGGIGFLYAYLQKPKYVASLSFALEDDKAGGGGISGALGLANSLGFDMGGGAGGAFSGSNLIELMKSRRLVEKALLNPYTVDGKKISLAEMYIKIHDWRKKWEKLNGFSEKIDFSPGVDRNKFTLSQDSLLGLIYSDIVKNKLIVEQKDKKISIIYVQVTTENELFSKYFAEGLAKEVSDFYIETKSKKAKTNVAILERQADSIRTELNNAITGVAIANDNTYNLNPALNIRRTPSSKRQVDVQANTAILTQLITNLEMAKATLLKETPLIQIIDLPILPLQIEKKSKLITAITFGIVFVFLVVFFYAVRMYQSQFKID